MNARHGGHIEGHGGGRTIARRPGSTIAPETVADDGGMFVQLLFHEMAEFAAADRGTGEGGALDLADHLGPGGVEEGGVFAGDKCPVAVTHIGDLAGHGGECQCVGPHEHFAVAETYGQRRAVAGGDDEFGVAGEQHRQGVGAFQAGEGGARRVGRGHAAGEQEIEQLHDRFGVGFGMEHLAECLEFGAEFGVIFDNAVMDDGNTRGAVRMRVGFGGRAMGGPARVADACRALQGLPVEHGGEIGESCPRHGGGRCGHSRGWRFPRCRSRDIPGGADLPGAEVPPPPCR